MRIKQNKSLSHVQKINNLKFNYKTLPLLFKKIQDQTML